MFIVIFIEMYLLNVVKEYKLAPLIIVFCKCWDIKDFLLYGI